MGRMNLAMCHRGKLGEKSKASHVGASLPNFQGPTEEPASPREATVTRSQQASLADRQDRGQG